MREYDVARANGSRSKTWRNVKMTWEAFCDWQRSPRRTAETQAEYAAMPKAERDAAKNGPAFVGGYLEGGRRCKGSVRHRSLLALDADMADGDVEADWELLVGSAACAWPTHSSGPAQRKMRIVAPLSRDVGPDEYVPLALKVMEVMGLGRFDPTTVEPERLMYCASASADAPFGLWECGGGPLDVDGWLGTYADWRDASCWPLPARATDAERRRAGDPEAKKGVVGAFCRCYTVAEAVEAFLADVYEPAGAGGARWTYRAGSSLGGMRVYEDKWAWSDHATDPANIGHLVNAYDLVRLHRFGGLDADAEDGTPVASLPSSAAMREWAVGLPEVGAELTRAQLGEAAADFADRDGAWMAELEHNARTGAVAPSARNLRLILANDPEMAGHVAYDVLEDAVCAVGGLPWRDFEGQSAWRDSDDAQLRIWFEVKYRIEGPRKIDDALEAEAAAHPRDALRERLLALPEWDGTERVDTLLVRALGAEDSPYVRAVTRKTLCGAVRRALRPGCKFDYMLVLEGPQGIGKSTLWARLGGDFFTDAFTLQDILWAKVGAEKLQGKWIAEVAELDGMAKASIESLKAFLSTQADRYRAAYARRAASHPRRSIIVGTVNNLDGYLRDVTGNRRFWPVPVTRQLDLSCVAPGEVDQLWAEALALEGAERLYLEGGAADEAERRQREAMEADPREGLVAGYLERLVPPDIDGMPLEAREMLYAGDGGDGAHPGWATREEVSVIEVWHECLGMDARRPTRTDSFQVAAILKRLGWVPTGRTKRTKAYGSVKVYSKEKIRSRGAAK